MTPSEIAESQGRWVRLLELQTPEQLTSAIDLLSKGKSVARLMEASSRVTGALAEAEAIYRALLSVPSSQVIARRALANRLRAALSFFADYEIHALWHTNVPQKLARIGASAFVDEPSLQRAHNPSGRYGEIVVVASTQQEHQTSIFRRGQRLPRGVAERAQEEFPLLRTRPLASDHFLSTTDLFEATSQEELSFLQRNTPPSRETDSFSAWVDDLIDAFDDPGDFQRPRYVEGEPVGAVILAFEAADPQELQERLSRVGDLLKGAAPLSTSVGRFGALRPHYGRQAIVEVSGGSGVPVGAWLRLEEAEDLQQEFEDFRFRLPQLRDRIRQAVGPLASLSADSRAQILDPIPSIAPDFQRAALHDLIPALRNISLGIDYLAQFVGVEPPELEGLESLARELSQAVRDLVGIYQRVLEALRGLQQLCEGTSANLLWIDPQNGGVPGLKRAIRAADFSRKDLQRVIFQGSSQYDVGTLLPYDEAVAERRRVGFSFSFAPAEDVFVGGVMLAFPEGPASRLLSAFFRPSAGAIERSLGGELSRPTLTETVEMGPLEPSPFLQASTVSSRLSAPSGNAEASPAPSLLEFANEFADLLSGDISFSRGGDSWQLFPEEAQLAPTRLAPTLLPTPEGAEALSYQARTRYSPTEYPLGPPEDVLDTPQHLGRLPFAAEVPVAFSDSPYSALRPFSTLIRNPESPDREVAITAVEQWGNVVSIPDQTPDPGDTLVVRFEWARDGRVGYASVEVLSVAGDECTVHPALPRYPLMSEDPSASSPLQAWVYDSGAPFRFIRQVEVSEHANTAEAVIQYRPAGIAQGRPVSLAARRSVVLDTDAAEFSWVLSSSDNFPDLSTAYPLRPGRVVREKSSGEVFPPEELAGSETQTLQQRFLDTLSLNTRSIPLAAGFRTLTTFIPPVDHVGCGELMIGSSLQLGGPPLEILFHLPAGVVRRPPQTVCGAGWLTGSITFIPEQVSDYVGIPWSALVPSVGQTEVELMPVLPGSTSMEVPSAPLYLDALSAELIVACTGVHPPLLSTISPPSSDAEGQSLGFAIAGLFQTRLQDVQSQDLVLSFSPRAEWAFLGEGEYDLLLLESHQVRLLVSPTGQHSLRVVGGEQDMEIGPAEFFVNEQVDLALHWDGTEEVLSVSLFPGILMAQVSSGRLDGYADRRATVTVGRLRPPEESLEVDPVPVAGTPAMSVLSVSFETT